MESQTRFDLSAALDDWRRELTAEPGLTPDAQRELETHLRDALAALKERGLDEDEAFCLARRRVGSPEKLADEFAKADPAMVWRHRVFWFAFGLLVFRLWNMLVTCFTAPLLIHPAATYDLLPEWVLLLLPWLRRMDTAFVLFNAIEITASLLAMAAVVLIAKGKVRTLRRMLEYALADRKRFIFLALALTAGFYGLGQAIWILGMKLQSPEHFNYATGTWLSGVVRLLWLIVVAVWLMPRRCSQKPVSA